MAPELHDMSHLSETDNDHKAVQAQLEVPSVEALAALEGPVGGGLGVTPRISENVGIAGNGVDPTSLAGNQDRLAARKEALLNKIPEAAELEKQVAAEDEVLNVDPKELPFLVQQLINERDTLASKNSVLAARVKYYEEYIRQANARMQEQDAQIASLTGQG